MKLQLLIGSLLILSTAPAYSADPDDAQFMTHKEVDDLLNDQAFLEQRLKDLKAQQKNVKPKKVSRLPNGQRPTALGRFADRFVDNERQRQMYADPQPNYATSTYWIQGHGPQDSGFVLFTPTPTGGVINNTLLPLSR